MEDGNDRLTARSPSVIRVNGTADWSRICQIYSPHVVRFYLRAYAPRRRTFVAMMRDLGDTIAANHGTFNGALVMRDCTLYVQFSTHTSQHNHKHMRLCPTFRPRAKFSYNPSDASDGASWWNELLSEIARYAGSPGAQVALTRGAATAITRENARKELFSAQPYEISVSVDPNSPASSYTPVEPRSVAATSTGDSSSATPARKYDSVQAEVKTANAPPSLVSSKAEERRQQLIANGMVGCYASRRKARRMHGARTFGYSNIKTELTGAHSIVTSSRVSAEATEKARKTLEKIASALGEHVAKQKDPSKLVREPSVIIGSVLRELPSDGGHSAHLLTNIASNIAVAVASTADKSYLPRGIEPKNVAAVTKQAKQTYQNVLVQGCLSDMAARLFSKDSTFAARIDGTAPDAPTVKFFRHHSRFPYARATNYVPPAVAPSTSDAPAPANQAVKCLMCESASGHPDYSPLYQQRGDGKFLLQLKKSPTEVAYEAGGPLDESSNFMSIFRAGYNDKNYANRDKLVVITPTNAVFDRTKLERAWNIVNAEPTEEGRATRLREFLANYITTPNGPPRDGVLTFVSDTSRKYVINVVKGVLEVVKPVVECVKISGTFQDRNYPQKLHFIPANAVHSQVDRK